jgi:hypothetical protein
MNKKVKKYILISFVILICILEFIGLWFLLSKKKFSKSHFTDILEPDKVPQIIHRTFRTRAEAKKLYDNAWKTTAKNLPQWEQRFYSDNDIAEWIPSTFGSSSAITKAYQAINPEYGAARADLFRYLIVYIYGGLYLDIKSLAISTLPEIPNKGEIMVSRWRLPCQREAVGLEGEFQNWHIYARPRAKALLAVIRHVVQNIATIQSNPKASCLSLGVDRSDSKGKVLGTTGPIAYTIALKKFYNNYRDKVIKIAPDNDNHEFITAALASTSENMHQIFNNQGLGGVVIYEGHDSPRDPKHYSNAKGPLIQLNSKKITEEDMRELEQSLNNHRDYTSAIATLTTIPSRARDPHFVKVIRHLASIPGVHKVLLNLPHKYALTGEPYILHPSVKDIPNVIINRCNDEGPATKLLGALRTSQISNDMLLFVCDDDILLTKDSVTTPLKIMKDAKRKFPNQEIVVANCSADIQGFQGYLVRKQTVLGILKFPMPKSCLTIDDDWIEAYFKMQGVRLICGCAKVLIDRRERWCKGDWRCTIFDAKHPSWPELCTDKKKRPELRRKCIKDLNIELKRDIFT